MPEGEQIASLIYPPDTSSMYAGTPGERRGHVLIRDRRGEVHRVTAFRTFECPAPLTQAAQCTDRPGFEYHYRDLMQYIDDHRGTGDLDVEVIYRTWRIRPGVAPEH